MKNAVFYVDGKPCIIGVENGNINKTDLFLQNLRIVQADSVIDRCRYNITNSENNEIQDKVKAAENFVKECREVVSEVAEFIVEEIDFDTYEKHITEEIYTKFVSNSYVTIEKMGKFKME